MKDQDHKKQNHYHSTDHKRKVVNRLSRAIGHLNKVKQMVEDDADCSEILIQLSAVESALHNTGKVIINEHIDHCIYHALEDNDTKMLAEFREAVSKYI